METAEKPKSKLLLFFAVLLIVVAGVVAAVYYYFPRGDIHYKNLYQQDLPGMGVSFPVPEGWVINDSGTGFVPSAHHDHDSPIAIEVKTFGTMPTGLNEESQKRLVDSIKKDSDDGKYDFGFVESNTTTINGIYGIHGKTDESSSMHAAVFGWAFVSIHPDGNLYKIVAMAPERDFQSNESGMKKIIQGVTFKKVE